MKSPKRDRDAGPFTAHSLIQELASNGTSLERAIEEVLVFLEDRKLRGERLPTEYVELAITLIRMYSEPDLIDMQVWIERERARRLATAMARHRVLGSNFGPSKKAKRLPPPPPEPEGLDVSLFDLVKTFQRALEIAVSRSSK